MRPILLAVILVATGCGIENDFGFDIPVWPDNSPPDVGGVTQTDVMVQVTTPQVDILWMVDNSCSMSNEQTELTQNFPFFMDFFVGSGLDYHVAVTSSDIISSNYPGSSGTLVIKQGLTYIDPDTPNPTALFTQMANLGTTGRFPERGLGATYLALEIKRNTTNAGFYREKSALHTIVISDEPDFTEASTITQPEYVDWYRGLKPEKDDRTFSAIIDPNRGTDYSNTVNQVENGILWSLSDGNWPGVLEQLGLQASGYKREFFLSRLPVPGTIDVTVETPTGAILEFEESTDWTYDELRNSVQFNEYYPDSLAKVRLNYDVLAANQDSEEL